MSYVHCYSHVHRRASGCHVQLQVVLRLMPFRSSPMRIYDGTVIGLVGFVLLHLVHQWMSLCQVHDSAHVGVVLGWPTRGWVLSLPEVVCGFVISQCPPRHPHGNLEPLLVQQVGLSGYGHVGMPRLLFEFVGPRLVCARQRLRTMPSRVSPAPCHPISNPIVDAKRLALWIDIRQRLGTTTSAAGAWHLRQGLRKSDAATRTELTAMDTRIRCVVVVVEAFVIVRQVGMVLWQ